MKRSVLGWNIGVAVIVAVTWFAGVSSIALAQEHDEAELRGEVSETHAMDAIRWHEEYSNPSNDPNALTRRFEGFQELRRMPNAVAMKALSTAAWLPVGTSQTDDGTQHGNISGRGTCIAVASDGTIYYGATQGGLWKSVNNGNNWTSLSDHWATLAVGGVAVDPKNPKVVYAGTGEGMAFLDDGGNTYAVVGPTSGGTGVLKSTDGGLNWYVAYPKTGLISNGMTVNWANSNLVYLTCPQGVVMSSDSGHTWQSTLVFSNTSTYALGTNLIVDPSDASVLYAAGGGLAPHQLTPGVNATIWKSRDSGKTWHKLTGYAGGPSIALGISPANHLQVWASIDFSTGSRIDSSQDSGATWGKAFLALLNRPNNFLGTQGTYANCIAISPTNENKVIVGGLNVYSITFNQGSFTVDSTQYNTQNDPSRDDSRSYAHPDVHVLMFDSKGRLYTLTDGGIHYSPDEGKNWYHEMNQNLGTFEFVGGDMYPNAAGEPMFFVAGAQDNGLNRLDFGSKVWSKIHDGDGGRMFISQTDGQTIYGSYVQSTLYQSMDGGDSWETNSFGWGDNILFRSPIQNENVPFYMEYDVSSVDPTQIALCGLQHVFLTTTAFGTTGDPFAIAGTGSANAITGVPQCVQFGAGGEIFIGTRSKAVYYSTTMGDSFSKSTFNKGIPSCFATTQDDKTVFLTTKTNGNLFGGSFYLSNDGGQTWTEPANNGLSKNLNYYAVAASNKLVFVGNDYGVLYSTDQGATWINTSVMGFPQVQVTSLRIRGHYVIATTYGRGMYFMDISSLAGVSQSDAAPIATSASISGIYPNPVTTANARTNIRFSLNEDSRATISIYDVLGRQERVLINEWSAKGDHETNVDLSSVPAGQHYISLTAAGTTVTRAITIE